MPALALVVIVIVIVIVLMRFAFRLGKHFDFSDRTPEDFGAIGGNEPDRAYVPRKSEIKSKPRQSGASHGANGHLSAKELVHKANGDIKSSKAADISNVDVDRADGRANPVGDPCASLSV